MQRQMRDRALGGSIAIATLLSIVSCASVSDYLGVGEFDARTLLENKTYICPGKRAGQDVQKYGDAKMFAAYTLICGDESPPEN